ncbi:MAG: type II toxin-antitoxin system VapC family toxin [Coleofasciculus sp. G3-WIS-01]|uniref:type II toxin-antitoxin system VapC family toxin n=1 Tax=Coleofasciculus sp. G3-WIS-01 TaxID=3069528 RepID=UPI0032F8B4CE
MAIYVVDASVVVQYAITQTYTPEARVLVARMYQGDQLCIPEFCLLECVNVLWKEVRFRGLPKTQAEQIVGELLALSFRIMPTVHLLPSALQIGLSYQLALYDSLYIALAVDLNCPLVTVDDRQRNGAIASGVIVKPITDFSPA